MDTKWISVSEKLPAIGERVIAWDEREDNIVLATWDYEFASFAPNHKGELKFWSESEVDELPPIVTHWMLLPPPPHGCEFL